jgi:hypothetical protein
VKTLRVVMLCGLDVWSSDTWQWWLHYGFDGIVGGLIGAALAAWIAGRVAGRVLTRTITHERELNEQNRAAERELNEQNREADRRAELRHDVDELHRSVAAAQFYIVFGPSDALTLLPTKGPTIHDRVLEMYTVGMAASARSRSVDPQLHEDLDRLLNAVRAWALETPDDLTKAWRLLGELDVRTGDFLDGKNKTEVRVAGEDGGWADFRDVNK